MAVYVDDVLAEAEAKQAAKHMRVAGWVSLTWEGFRT